MTVHATCSDCGERWSDHAAGGPLGEDPVRQIEPPPSELPAAAEVVGRLFPRKRSTLRVSIDLDPVSGWGNDPDDHRALVQRLLDEVVPHYNPQVEIAPSAAESSS